MSWGTDLWDQYDNLSSHTHKGIDFCEKYTRFVKERCEVENDYAAKLKKLVKNYQPKKKEEEDNVFTWAKGFQNMVNEIHDVAGQHEQIAENLATQIAKELQALVHELKKERKEHLSEGSKLDSKIQAQLSQLDRVKKKYEKSFSDSEKASDAFKRADADINLSRAEVEKAKIFMHQKQSHCETCKKEYASELQKTNQHQTEHYSTSLPQVFQRLQALEVRRIERVKEFISKSAETERSVIPIVNTCIDGMVRAAAQVDPQKDIELVVEKYKSGFTPPTEIPFEDLSNGNVVENHTQNFQNTPVNQRLESGKGTVSGKTKKRAGLFGGIFSSSKGTPGNWKPEEIREDYSHLPPNQQKKQLQQKLDSIKALIATETNARDGMQKMRDVYVQNPALGDALTIDRQLEENGQKLDKFNQELQKYEGYMHKAEGRSTSLHPNSGGVERKMSDLSLHSSNAGSNPGTPSQVRSTKITGGAEAANYTEEQEESSKKDSSGEQRTYQNVPNNKASPTSNHTNPQSTSPGDVHQYTEQESFEDDLDDEDFAVIGHCKALYSFDAPNEGAIAMKEGQEFQVVEQDQGDGWTRVRNSAGDEGFVPTSYVELHLD